jgi:putative hemolysin
MDNIVGVVYHKDISRYVWAKQSFDLGSILKRPYFVPDTMKISVLFKDMQKRRVHLAVVVDEYGTTVGIVTMEDIMEELFGEIMDETDTDVRIERTREGATIADASISIRDLNNALNFDLPESPEYETLGGFVLDKIQGIAKGGEIVHHGDLRFTVVGIHGRRISKVKIENKGRAPNPQKS